MCTSSEGAAKIFSSLVLHAKGDSSVPFEEGRIIAGLIPNSRFVLLDGRNHILLPHEKAWKQFFEEVRRFVSGGNGDAAGFPQLSDRQGQVLELIARGLDNAQIAVRLELSEKTVRNHITGIFEKLQVETRAQAIVRARDAGMGRS